MKSLPLDQLAIRNGLLDRETVERVRAMQSGPDEIFGKIALQLGALDSQSLNALLQEQRATHLYIGEALMRKGVLSAMKLAELLDRFKESEGGLPVPVIPSDLYDHLLSATLLELLPRMALSVAHVKLDVVAVRDWGGPSTMPYGVALDVESGGQSISIGIAVDHELGVEFASGMLCCTTDLIDPGDIEDSLGEFLNILVGNVKVKLERSEPELSVPNYDGVPQSGYAVDLEPSVGSGMLILMDL